MKPNPQQPTRKFFVLREVEIEAKDLKENDIFRMQPASADDFVNVNPREFFMVTKNPEAVPAEKGNLMVAAVPVSIVRHETFAAGRQFTKVDSSTVMNIIKKAGFKLQKIKKTKAVKPKKKR